MNLLSRKEKKKTKQFLRLFSSVLPRGILLTSESSPHESSKSTSVKKH